MIVTHQSGGVIGTTPLPQVHDRYPPVRWCDRNHPVYPRYMIVPHQSGGVIGTTPYPRYMIVTHQSGGVIGTTPPTPGT